MTLSAPVISFRDPVTLAVLSSITLTGSGPLGAVPVGSASNVATLRIYNNYSAAANIASATNCTLASYDNTSTQYLATSVSVVNAWLQVRWFNMDGVTTNADQQFYPIGGAQKHATTMNSGTLAATGAHYATVQLQVVVPSAANGGTITQGLWLECNYNL